MTAEGQMRIWTCKFVGHWPVGAVGIVVAKTKERADTLFRRALHEDGLDASQDLELESLDTSVEAATLLLNGDY